MHFFGDFLGQWSPYTNKVAILGNNRSHEVEPVTDIGSSSCWMQGRQRKDTSVGLAQVFEGQYCQQGLM